MKIVLVDNLLLKRENDREQFIMQPHLGLISLIAILENEGYEAVLYDPKIDLTNGNLLLDDTLYKEIARTISVFKPDMVGFTSLGCNFICTLKIARYLKAEQPALPILLGGPHATVLDQEILQTFNEFDVIVRNEAEHTIIPVIKGLLNGNLSQVPGITFRKNGKVVQNKGLTIIEDLDTLPFPAYHAYPIEHYQLQSLRVEAGRGCPFSCTFCSTATFFGRSYRLKPAPKLLQELDFLNEKYAIENFGLTHDLFTVNRHKILAFCELMKHRNYTWRCSARMDCVDEELLTNMKEAGCVSIYYGIETGSQRMQRISKKKLDLTLFYEGLHQTLRLGISPTLSFIIGYPEETTEDANDTLDMISKCWFIDTPVEMSLQLHLLTPEPGTALHEQYKRNMGFDDYISDFNFPTLEADDADIMKRYPDIFMNHHYYKTLLPRHFFVVSVSLFEVLLSLGKTITRYILSFFEKKLSVLTHAVSEWAEQMAVKSIHPANFLLYMTQTFSEKHVLVSLLRYQFEINELQQNGWREAEESVKFSIKNRQEEKTSFRWLKKIHNCPAIIKKLESNKNIPITLQQSRHDFILNLDENSSPKRIECYKINTYTAGILKPIEDTVLSKTDTMLRQLLGK